MDDQFTLTLIVVASTFALVIVLLFLWGYLYGRMGE